MNTQPDIDDGAPQVRDVMTTQPITLPPQATVLEVVEVLARHNIGAVIVTEAGRPVGIIAERDLVRSGRDCRRWHEVPVREVMTSGPQVVSPHDSWNTALDTMQQFGIRHMPVVEDGIVVGMLSIRDLMKHRTELLAALVEQRTAQLARRSRALAERDRERTRTLRIAGRIQRQILPSGSPQVPGLEIASAYHPLEEVAGDFFDFAFTDPQTLVAVIGDAAGHGVPAAFIALIANTCLRSHVATHPSPGALLSAMNDCLFGWVETEHFVSMFVAAIDVRSRRMTIARAGHPRPLLLRADGRISELEADGIMLGVDAHPAFEEHSVQLRTGDRVLLFTDGLPECRNAEGELFGTGRLRRFLLEHRQLSSGDFVKALVDRAREFAGHHGLSDDLTLVLLDATDAGGTAGATAGEARGGAKAGSRQGVG